MKLTIFQLWAICTVYPEPVAPEEAECDFEAHCRVLQPGDDSDPDVMAARSEFRLAEWSRWRAIHRLIYPEGVE